MSWISWLDDNGVIPVGNVHVLDGDSGTRWVDTVSVEWHSWPCKLYSTFKEWNNSFNNHGIILQEVSNKANSKILDPFIKWVLLLFADWTLMLEHTCDNFHIMNVYTVNISEFQIESGTVDPLDSCNLWGLNSVVLKKNGSFEGILMSPVSDPPVITEAINGTLTFNIDHLTIIKGHEIGIWFIWGIQSPIFPMWAGFQDTINLEGDIVEILEMHGVGGNDVAFRDDNSLVIRLISFLEAFFDSHGIIICIFNWDIKRPLWNSSTIHDNILIIGIGYSSHQ